MRERIKQNAACSILTLLLLLLVSDFVSLTAHADASTYVYDDAYLIDSSSAAALQRQGENIAALYECGVYVVTTPDMGAEGYYNIESYGEYVYQKLGLGYGADRDMVLLVISMADRDYDITAHGTKGNGAFTDYGKDRMADQFVPYLSNGDYASAFQIYMNVAEDYLSRYNAGTPFDITADPAAKSAANSAKVGGCVFAGLIGAITSTLGLKSQMKSAKSATVADRYVTAEGLALSRRNDRFLRRSVSRVRVRTERDNSGGGGGGTTINSGGFSHSSGKF